MILILTSQRSLRETGEAAQGAMRDIGARSAQALTQPIRGQETHLPWHIHDAFVPEVVSIAAQRLCLSGRDTHENVRSGIVCKNIILEITPTPIDKLCYIQIN